MTRKNPRAELHADSARKHAMKRAWQRYGIAVALPELVEAGEQRVSMHHCEQPIRCDGHATRSPFRFRKTAFTKRSDDFDTAKTIYQSRRYPPPKQVLPIAAPKIRISSQITALQAGRTASLWTAFVESAHVPAQDGGEKLSG